QAVPDGQDDQGGRRAQGRAEGERLVADSVGGVRGQGFAEPLDRAGAAERGPLPGVPPVPALRQALGGLPRGEVVHEPVDHDREGGVVLQGEEHLQGGLGGGDVDPVGDRADVGAPVLREQVHPVLAEAVVDGGEEALVEDVAAHHGGQHHHVDGVVEAGDRVVQVGAGLRQVQGSRVVVADVDRVLGELRGHVGRIAGGPLRRGGGGR